MLRAELAAAFLLLTRLPLAFLARGAPVPRAVALHSGPTRSSAPPSAPSPPPPSCSAAALGHAARRSPPSGRSPRPRSPPARCMRTASPTPRTASAAAARGSASSPSCGTAASARTAPSPCCSPPPSAEPPSPPWPQPAPALIAAGALSRGALALPDPGPAARARRRLGRAARQPEPGAHAAWPRHWRRSLALLLLPPAPALGAIIAGAATISVLAALARRQIGGYTGDVLGAGVVAVECVVLTRFSRRRSEPPGACV